MGLTMKLLGSKYTCEYICIHTLASFFIEAINFNGEVPTNIISKAIFIASGPLCTYNWHQTHVVGGQGCLSDEVWRLSL